jgi:integrase
MRVRKRVSETALVVTNSDALRRGVPTWDDAVKVFLAGWRGDHPNVKDNTLAGYDEQLRSRLVRFAEGRGIGSPSEFRRDHLRAFVSWLGEVVTAQGKGLSQRGKQVGLDTAKRFFRWYAAQGVMPNITEGVGSFRLDKRYPEHLTPEQLRRLLAAFAIDGADERGAYEFARDKCMVVLLAFCGLRVGELVALNRVDLDAEQWRVRVQFSKTHRERFVDLPAEVRDGRREPVREVQEAIDLWGMLRSEQFPDLGDEGALFVTLQEYQPRGKDGTKKERVPRGSRITDNAVRLVLGRAAVRAGLPPKSAMPHKLRHSFGVLSAMEKVPPTAIMGALGHTTLHMTAHYMALTEQERSQSYAQANIAGKVLGASASRVARRSVGQVLKGMQKQGNGK